MEQIETRHDKKRGCGWRQPGGLYMVTGTLHRPCGLLPIPVSTCPCCSQGIRPARGFTWVNPQLLVGDKPERKCNLHGIDRCNEMLQVSPAKECGRCWEDWGDKAGLLWIGGSFYKTPTEWTREAITQGVSRRLAAVPKGFEVGKTWVLVAHRKAIVGNCEACGEQAAVESDAKVLCCGCGTYDTAPVTPAIFHAFMPTAIEYVVKDDEVCPYCNNGEWENERGTCDECGGTRFNPNAQAKIERLRKRGITPVIVRRVETTNGELAVA